MANCDHFAKGEGRCKRKARVEVLHDRYTNPPVHRCWGHYLELENHARTTDKLTIIQAREVK